MDKLIGKIFLPLIIANILLSAWFVFQGDIIFHTDIARDFLLVDEIVKNRDITLIGPRSGGVPGVFHGPLWLYLQVPAHIIGQGNPAAIGVFWILLTISAIGIVYWVARKIFDTQIAQIAALLMSTYLISSANNLFNPFGAVILAPIFIYLIWKYLKKLQFWYLVAGIFTLGIIIQFQMAFGVPILILTFFYLAFILFKKKKLHHLSAFAIILLPLSTFILFELKNNFLQLRSVIDYKLHPPAHTQVKFFPFILDRIKGFLFFGHGLNVNSSWILMLPFVSVVVYFFKKNYQKLSPQIKSLYLLFLYFYCGYWLIVTLFYRDIIWSYYYWPFLSISVILLAASSLFIQKKIYSFILISLYILMIFFSVKGIMNFEVHKSSNSATWQYFYGVANKIYDDAPSDFGYFIYTPDLFGYSYKYAMVYTQKNHDGKDAHPFEKKAVTYLLIAPPPDDRPFLKGDWWRTNQVKIDKKPVKVFNYSNGFKVEKYILTPEEQKITSDPNLIQNLHFR